MAAYVIWRVPAGTRQRDGRLVRNAAIGSMTRCSSGFCVYFGLTFAFGARDHVFCGRWPLSASSLSFERRYVCGVIVTHYVQFSVLSLSCSQAATAGVAAPPSPALTAVEVSGAVSVVAVLAVLPYAVRLL